jgi:hypothetical protein
VGCQGVKPLIPEVEIAGRVTISRERFVAIC